MKEFQLCGLGNAIVDLFLEVSDQQFADFGFERGTMRLVDVAEQQVLLNRTANPRLVSGGSVGNSVIGFAQLGGRAAYIGTLGSDAYGEHYQKELKDLGIAMGQAILKEENTGTSCVLITPDAERTMRTCLGAAEKLSGKHVAADRKLIEASEWVFIEGYLFSNNEPGQQAVREALAVAAAANTKIAITCSDAFIVHVFGHALKDALNQADLFFCNAAEAMAVTNTADSQLAFEAMKDIVPNCVVTDGPAGAYIRWEGKECHVPAFRTEPKDLTGAGDMFAAAFLYGVLHGHSPEAAGRGANYLASRVIRQVGARLDIDIDAAKAEFRA